MSAPTSTTEEKPRKRRGRRPRPKAEEGSKEAKRLATAILEVLAGTRTPGEAASLLEVSLPRYYALEAIAIAGLVSSCEPRNQSAPTPESELASLRKVNEKLERECARQQALLRMAQRTVGLPPPPPKEEKKGKRGGGRRPRVRALTAIAAIGSAHDERSQTAGNEARRPNGRLVAGEASPESDP